MEEGHERVVEENMILVINSLITHPEEELEVCNQESLEKTCWLCESEYRTDGRINSVTNTRIKTGNNVVIHVFSFLLIVLDNLHTHRMEDGYEALSLPCL